MTKNGDVFADSVYTVAVVSDNLWFGLRAIDRPYSS